MSKKFLVAVDGSDHAQKALELAASLAKPSDAALVILHVVPFERVPEAFQRFAEIEGIAAGERAARYRYDMTIGDSIVSEAETYAREHGVERIKTVVAEGSPANEIVAQARSERVDMIFLGSRGVSDLKGLLIGSVSHRVMHLAPCTCVAVR